MATGSRNIWVYAHQETMPEPFCVGVLNSERLRGKEVFSFEYDKQWLKSGSAMALDPDLQLFSGRQFLQNESKSNFGIFTDSAPDRWGRLLMRRREAALAKQEKRPVENLYETDYLLGVYDKHRMGALRFKTAADGAFLNNEQEYASPPWTELRKLEEISLKLEQDDASNDPEYLNWLNVLVAPGSSLGGARPKASVVDNSGHLWVAKFPSKNDDFDIGAWEMLVHDLAKLSGIKVAYRQVKQFSSTQHTYLSKRFDRTEDGKRIHFASAMTLLGYTDGNAYQDGVSYLELAEFIANTSANVHEDLEELWRRIVFNMAVSNTDDHLRNHGFMLENGAWRLSPAYDMNADEQGMGLKLNVTEHDNALSLDLAMEILPYFRLPESKAKNITDKIKLAICQWEVLAKKYKISKAEQVLKAPAFEKVFKKY